MRKYKGQTVLTTLLVASLVVCSGLSWYEVIITDVSSELACACTMGLIGWIYVLCYELEENIK
jgi:hypothetical protein